MPHATLEFRQLDFTYPDTGIQALKALSFELKPGEKLGIVGPTGSGKSTLCAMIPRLWDSTKGEIFVGGMPIRTYSKEALRTSIGFAPQDVFLFSDSIKGNIAFGLPGATDEQVKEAARWSSIHDNIEGFKEGYETLVGERGVTLSGGQKQRISIARAWIRKPKILVLDDVLSAVDTKTEESILTQLQKYKRDHPDVSIVMVAHRLSCVQDADRIIVMEDGRITEVGTHESLIQKGGYYARIYQKQQLEEQVST